MGVIVYMDSTNHDQTQAAKSTINSSYLTLLTKQTVMDWKWKKLLSELTICEALVAQTVKAYWQTA